MTTIENVIYKSCAILFGGAGGATIGFMNSMIEYGGKVFRLKPLCSIDFDPIACRNHDLLVGDSIAVEMDLFRRWQFEAWHGHEPPKSWRERTPWDIWVAFKYQVPFFLFSSPPCKGLSGLLANNKAASEKYQALNHLTVSGLELSLQACLEYGGSVPAVIHLENVPRITSRGKPLLQQIKKLLKRYGYVVSIRADHNLGEIGGLGQNRIRFLILARHEGQLPNFIYYPEKKPLKSIGDILSRLPAPGDIEKGGPLHRIPRLQWKSWLKLALIPAGGDWRSLNNLDYSKLSLVFDDGSQGLANDVKGHGNKLISDQSLSIGGNGKFNILRIQTLDKPATCITGASGPFQGAASIADTSIPDFEYHVQHLDQLKADIQLNCTPRSNSYGVQEWDLPSKTIIGSSDIHAAAVAVADPRIPDDNKKGVWVIKSLDGTWHRPLTTYELAMIQSFPTHLPDGRPFQMVECSDEKVREYIGNAYPPQAALQTGNVILLAAAEAEAEVGFSLGYDPVWVQPSLDQVSVVIH